MDIRTIMQRNEYIKELFFNYSTKHWHFEELVNQSKLSRAQTNEWIQRLLKERLIKRVKKRNKMPYYIAEYNTPSFHIQKKTYALLQFEKTGFLEHLSTLKDAKTVIIFGSFSRADWHNESDIDLFIYGKAQDFEKGLFEKRLKREIQVFQYETPAMLKRLEPSVIPNILAGIHVKGTIEPFEVSLHA
jgi:predicted nucleotidyltransferase